MSMILSISPADALIIDGVSEGDLFFKMQTASNLKAKADLITAPILFGSVSWSSISNF